MAKNKKSPIKKTFKKIAIKHEYILELNIQDTIEYEIESLVDNGEIPEIWAEYPASKPVGIYQDEKNIYIHLNKIEEITIPDNKVPEICKFGNCINFRKVKDEITGIEIELKDCENCKLTKLKVKK